MATNFDFDLLNETIESAPSVGFGPRVTFGKMTIESINVISWDRSGGKSATAKMKERPFAKGETVKDGEYLQMTLAVNIQELNPALTFEYKRRVDIRKSSGDGKAKTDWSEIVEPALLSQIGKDWAKKLAKGVYVEVEDAETVQTDKNGKLRGFYKKVDGVPTEDWLVNTAPKVVAVFKSKADCEAARQSKFQKREDGDSEASNGNIPANIIKDVKGLMNAVDEDQLLEILSNNAPYSNYDTNALLAAANA